MALLPDSATGSELGMTALLRGKSQSQPFGRSIDPHAKDRYNTRI
jgi:hypothetical protein